MEKTTLTRDVFLQMREELSGKKDEYVDIAPGVQARVAQLTSDAGFALISMATDENADEKTRLRDNNYRWICACVLDENDNPVFTIEDLKTLPFEFTQRLARVVNRVNGLSDTGDSVDAAEKNSVTTLS